MVVHNGESISLGYSYSCEHTKNLVLVGVHSDEVYDLRIFFKLDKICML